MQIFCKIIPHAKQNKITVLPNGCFKIHLTAPAQKGEANKLLRRILADHLGVSKSKVKLLKGEKNRKKIVEILGL